MNLTPAILALHLAALIQSLIFVLSAGFALRVQRQWDLNSGSQRQLELERLTYLMATLMAWVFGANLLSLLLFVSTAEQLSSQFVGAMCATGVLNANPWGWPALMVKMALFFASAAWLILNAVDNRAPDYPLVRPKYALLLMIAPLAWADALVQWLFFSGLRPDVITSCCGSLFSAQGQGVAAEVAGLEPAVSLGLLYGSAPLLLGLGWGYCRRGHGAWPFASMAVLTFVLALVAIVSGVALYVYEHPHHHCPFCLLKGGHHYVGYGLYLPLFAATALALATAVLEPWRKVPSLTSVIAATSPRLVRLALILYSLFYGLATALVLTSKLHLIGQP